MAKKEDVDKEDILLKKKEDRRILPNVQDHQKLRNKSDRRGSDKHKEMLYFASRGQSGERYVCKYNVIVSCITNSKVTARLRLKSSDVSTTGILLECNDLSDRKKIVDAQSIQLVFKIAPGSMPEGYEYKIRVKATLTRDFTLPDEA